MKRYPSCRFTPTCSAYAIEAFQKRGFFVGLALTVRRVLRCNPFCPGGYDPVPEHGFTNRDTGCHGSFTHADEINSDDDDGQDNSSDRNQ